MEVLNFADELREDNSEEFNALIDDLHENYHMLQEAASAALDDPDDDVCRLSVVGVANSLIATCTAICDEQRSI